jgi:hypothetical protein
VLVALLAPAALPDALLATAGGPAPVPPGVLLAAGLAGCLLAGAGAGLFAARRAEAQRAAYLAIAAGTMGLLCGVLQPLESRANDPSAFYRDVAARIGDEPLAAFGGLDFAPNWQLGRREVPILLTLRKADRFVERSGGRAWLVAEERKLARLGTPARTRIALRGGNGLVLLQGDPAPPSAAVTRLRPAAAGDS